MKCCRAEYSEEKVKGSIHPRNANKSADSKHVMLAGNPNCGKSTIFNRLCNTHVRTGNYPGVTVTRHVGEFASDIQIIDLPGTYSLSSATTDEQVASDELLDNDAEFIINIVDGTSLERSLYLTLELKMLGIPMLLVVNMWDEVKRSRLEIDLKKLSEMLHLDVIAVSGTTGEGMDELRKRIINHDWRLEAPHFIGSPEVESLLESVAGAAPKLYQPHALFYAKSALQGDYYPKAISEDPHWKQILDEKKNEFRSRGESIYQVIAEDRYATIKKILAECCSGKKQGNRASPTALIDRVVLNRFAAFPVFLVIMFLVYYISVTWLGSIVTDWTNDTLFGDTVIPAVSEGLTGIGAPDWLAALCADGIVGGVGAVLGFVPQMIILFALLSLLEECGYMTRASFILDRIFNLMGMSGKAFIPYLIGSGCGVPALMTARTLGSESERRLTLMTATMIPCGAKLPVIIVFAGAVFSDVPFFAPMMYLIAAFMIFLSAMILKKFQAFKPSAAPMMLELPSYHLPSLRVMLMTVWHRTKGYIIKAGTIIFPCVTVLWLASHIGYISEEHRFAMLEDEQTEMSLVASAVKPVSGIFEPVGFNDYRAAVSVITGLLAKESIVSTMAVFTSTENPEDLDEDAADEEVENVTNTFYEALRNSMFHIDKIGTAGVLGALSFVIFNLFTIPCVAAVGVLRKEISSRRLFWTAVAYQLSFSYFASLCVYQFGLLITGAGTFGFWSAVAVVYLLVIAYIVFLKKSPKLEPALGERIDFTAVK